MFFTHYKLKKALKNLTIEDFEFKIYTVIRTIDMNKIKVVERKMTISGEIQYLVDIPYVDGCNNIFYNDYIIYHRSLKPHRYFSINEKQYNEFEEKYNNIDTLQIEVFIIEAKLRNRVVQNLLKKYYLYNKYDGCSRICEEFKCINYNFEPFITGNKQFTEDDKARLFYDILKYYCI